MADAVDPKQALLAQLKDVHEPAVSALPAIGWWLLLVVLVLLLLAYFKYRKRKAFNVWQGQVEKQLNDIAQQSNTVAVSETLSRCSTLARKLLLLCEPRELVASLQGEAWLAKLDEVCEQPIFSSGYGSLLLDTQYQANPEVRQEDLSELIDAMQLLFKQVKRRGPLKDRAKRVR